MKKTFLSLISMAFAINFSHAQTNIFPSSGNVGVGTTSPSQNLFGLNKFLDVAGATAPGIVFHSGGSGQEVAIGSGGDGLILGAAGASTAAGNNVIRFFTGSTNSSYSASERLRIDESGNVGIGTTVPQTNLHIVGTGASIDAGNIEYSGGGLIVQGNTGSRSSTTGAQLEFVIPASTDGTNLWGQGRIITVAGTSSNDDATGKMIIGTRRMINKLGIGAQWYYGNDLVIDGSGNVGIGTLNPQGYQLAVNGTAIATSMTVKLYSAWPDYVFKPTYHLPTLTDVKTYIDKNHHLPDMLSEQEVAKNGINLGETDRLLTKKVEELTLYLIEKDKTDKEKDAKLQLQQKQLEIQQQEIDELKKQISTLINLKK